ncbi:MAG: hypothetical protein NVS4B3_01670 [Gemmatimonadaceae bacterium]
MPIDIATEAPTVLIQREAFERSRLTRAALDAQLGLTAEEFRVEGALVAIGPIYADGGVGALIDMLEVAGLVYFDDFFELSGNWPVWLRLLAMPRHTADRATPIA